MRAKTPKKMGKISRHGRVMCVSVIQGIRSDRADAGPACWEEDPSQLVARKRRTSTVHGSGCSKGRVQHHGHALARGHVTRRWNEQDSIVTAYLHADFCFRVQFKTMSSTLSLQS
jgi:hypothetical protein